MAVLEGWLSRVPGLANPGRGKHHYHFHFWLLTFLASNFSVFNLIFDVLDFFWKMKLISAVDLHSPHKQSPRASIKIPTFKIPMIIIPLKWYFDHQAGTYPNRIEENLQTLAEEAHWATLVTRLLFIVSSNGNLSIEDWIFNLFFWPRIRIFGR